MGYNWRQKLWQKEEARMSLTEKVIMMMQEIIFTMRCIVITMTVIVSISMVRGVVIVGE